MPDLSAPEAALQNGEISMMRVTSQTCKIQSCLSEKNITPVLEKLKKNLLNER